MFLNTCPFCEHGNPTDSKFCNACGGALHLLPCPRCGAVSDVTATTCYQCHGQLPGRGTAALDSASSVSELPKPLRRPHFRVMVGMAVLAVITMLVYYSYRQRSHGDSPNPQAAISEASGRGNPAGTSVIWWDAAAGDATLAKQADSAGPASPATALPEIPLAGPTPPAVNQPRAGRKPVDSREAKVAVAPIARTKAINEGRVSEQGPSRPEVCTEAVAALGLCTVRPAQKKEAETVAATQSIPRPGATDTGKAGRQEPPRGEACTEAVSALGLCMPTRRRE